MKNFFIVVDVKNKEDKYYSYVLKVGSSDNLVNKIKNIKGLVAASIAQTKKEAYHIVSHKNAIYKIDNRYMFDEVKF